jgi:ribosomal protein L29
MTYTTAELQALSIDELVKEAHKSKQEVFRLALLIRTGSEKNTSQLRRARKYVARLEGAITAKKSAELAVAKQAKKSVNSKKSV